MKHQQHYQLPQVSHRALCCMGPLLFLIYFNGLCSVQLSDGTLILFADDLLLYRPIYGVRDFMPLQNDVDAIFNWIQCNFLSFNVQKCKQMTITRKKHPISTTAIEVDGNALDLVNAYKYLGVWGYHGVTSAGPSR